MMTRLKAAARQGFQNYLRAKEAEAARTIERHRRANGDAQARRYLEG